MKQFKRILVATDTRLEDHPIVAEAVEIAALNKAALCIVDVVPEFPWTVRLTLKDHDQIRRLIAEEKQDKLSRIAAPIRERGVDVSTKVLYGKTSLEIIREVLRAQHDLVLRVAKGKQSRRTGFFGNTGLRLLRKCPCAVWLVSPATTPDFAHVLGSIDTSTGDPIEQELNEEVFDLAQSISQYHEGRFSIVQAWSIFGEQFVRGRLQPDELENLEKQNEEQVSTLLDNFLQQHGSSIRDENVHLVKGEAPDVIPTFAKQNGVELVVMGTVARSGVSGVVMGNTAEQILNRIECSVLAIKPSGFVCPIKLEH